MAPFLLASLCAQRSNAERVDSNADIAKFEADFSSALSRNAIDELERFLSPDSKVISGDGDIIEKSRFLKVIASGDLKHSSMIAEPMRLGPT